MTKHIVKLVFAAVLFSGGLMAQQEPAVNVNAQNHPEIAAAQRLAREAYDKITAAQNSNRMDMEGHAAKAKTLLIQVNQELQWAAEAANKHHTK